MALFNPVDPTQPITGEAALIVKNVANTGNLLALTLHGDPQPGDHGLPTRLTWTVDDNSGGNYTGATGQGTAQIVYFPAGKLPKRAFGAGRFGIVFRGEVATVGVFNVVRD